FSATAKQALAVTKLPEELQKKCKQYNGRIKVWGVADSDYENDNDEDIFVLKFQSRQDPNDSDLKYKMRVTVQLTDKKTKEVVYAQTSHNPRSVGPDYAGYTEWAFEIPFGNLKKPKLTAYAIEFGFIEDSHFVPVGVDYDDVECAEEITEGEGTKVKMKRTKCAPHYYRN
ncbi:MAG: hypothetical protein OEL75_03955, partial [Kiritimatiellaceae bacterium]|nr:hypothetical protein [Kiritimatiellaceae bacterium]